jgi:hypothetical protein
VFLKYGCGVGTLDGAYIVGGLVAQEERKGRETDAARRNLPVAQKKRTAYWKSAGRGGIRRYAILDMSILYSNVEIR